MNAFEEQEIDYIAKRLVGGERNRLINRPKTSLILSAVALQVEDNELALSPKNIGDCVKIIRYIAKQLQKENK